MREPTFETVKMNCGAAWEASIRKGGTGVIARLHRKNTGWVKLHEQGHDSEESGGQSVNASSGISKVS